MKDVWEEDGGGGVEEEVPLGVDGACGGEWGVE